jgi:hypothetical protein
VPLIPLRAGHLTTAQLTASPFNRKPRDRNFEKIGIGFGKKFVKIGRPGIPVLSLEFPTDFKPDQK